MEWHPGSQEAQNSASVTTTGTNTRLLLLGKLSLDLFLMKATSSEISKYILLPKRQPGPKIFRSVTITFFFPLTWDSSLYYGG